MQPDQHFTFNGNDGYPIAGYAWLPADLQACKGVIQLSHGMAEHALRYGYLATTFNQAGYAVYAHDHRGHGATLQAPEDTGFFATKNGWPLVVNDLFLLNQRIKKEHPDQPIILLGHSMGTFIAQQYIAEHGDTLAGVILSATIDNAGFLRHIGLLVAKIERLRLGQRGQSKLLNAMSFGDFNKPFKPNRTEFDWLSRDTTEVDKYIADPLCGFIVTTQLWIDLLQGLGKMAKTLTRSTIPKDLPILLISGGNDPVTQKGKTVKKLQKRYQQLGLQSVNTHIYPEGRHESFNEVNKEEVIKDLIDWAHQTLKSDIKSTD